MKLNIQFWLDGFALSSRTIFYRHVLLHLQKSFFITKLQEVCLSSKWVFPIAATSSQSFRCTSTKVSQASKILSHCGHREFQLKCRYCYNFCPLSFNSLMIVLSVFALEVNTNNFSLLVCSRWKCFQDSYLIYCTVLQENGAF